MAAGRIMLRRLDELASFAFETTLASKSIAPWISKLKTTGYRAMAVHKRLGQSVVVWRDGKVVLLPAEEIPVDIEESENPKPYPTDDLVQGR